MMTDVVRESLAMHKACFTSAERRIVRAALDKDVGALARGELVLLRRFYLAHPADDPYAPGLAEAALIQAQTLATEVA
jgi:hypothetical protein